MVFNNVLKIVLNVSNRIWSIRHVKFIIPSRSWNFKFIFFICRINISPCLVNTSINQSNIFVAWVFKINPANIRLDEDIFVLTICLQYVFKTFPRRLQDVIRTFWRCVQDVFKTSWGKLGIIRWLLLYVPIWVRNVSYQKRAVLVKFEQVSEAVIHRFSSK